MVSDPPPPPPPRRTIQGTTSRVVLYNFKVFSPPSLAFTILLVFTGREHCELDILLFREVLDHIARVDRVLTAPGGSLLMGTR